MIEHTFISKTYPTSFQVYKSLSMTEKVIRNAKRYCKTLMSLWWCEKEKPTFCILLEQQREDFIVRCALIFANENYNIDKRNLNFSVRSRGLVHDQTWGILYHWNNVHCARHKENECILQGRETAPSPRIYCVCSLQVSLINALPWPVSESLGATWKRNLQKRPSGASLPS